MKKFIKILCIIWIVFLACSYISTVHASGVNMNLSGDSTTYGSSSNANNYNTNTYNSNSSSAIVSSTQPESNLDALTLSDMINIVLCAIGVILILLGIAIIIRQKSV